MPEITEEIALRGRQQAVPDQTTLIFLRISDHPVLVNEKFQILCKFFEWFSKLL